MPVKRRATKRRLSPEAELDAWRRSWGGQPGAADGINRKPGFLGYLARDAFVVLRPLFPSIGTQIRWCRILLRQRFPRLQQLGIPPDVFVALLFGQVEPVKASPGRFKCSGGRNEPA